MEITGTEANYAAFERKPSMLSCCSESVPLPSLHGALWVPWLAAQQAEQELLTSSQQIPNGPLVSAVVPSSMIRPEQQLQLPPYGSIISMLLAGDPISLPWPQGLSRCPSAASKEHSISRLPAQGMPLHRTSPTANLLYAPSGHVLPGLGPTRRNLISALMMAMGDNAPQNIILDGGVAAGQLPGSSVAHVVNPQRLGPGRQAPTGGDYGPSVVYQQAPDALKGWSYPKVACSTAAVVAQVLASLNSGSNISATHEQQSLMETDTAASPMYCAGPLQGPLSPALGYRPIHENVALPESRVVSTAVAPQLKQRKGVGKASLVRRYSKKSDARLPPKKQGRKGIPREHITVPMLMDGGYLDMPIQDAAAALGMGVSVLKRICRAMGLSRWPFRKRQSITHVISKTQQYLAEDRQEAVVTALEACLGGITGAPNEELDDAARQYRQSIYKLSHKISIIKALNQPMTSTRHKVCISASAAQRMAAHSIAFEGGLE